MTAEKLKSVLQEYCDHLNEKYPDIVPRQLAEFKSRFKSNCLSTADKVCHFKFMCNEAQLFVDQGRIDKAMRWLGFLQGVLWADSVFSLDELKRHSTP